MQEKTTVDFTKIKLSEIFDAFANKAVEDFPILEDSFVIYNAPMNSWHGSPGMDKKTNEAAQYLLKHSPGEMKTAAAFASSKC